MTIPPSTTNENTSTTQSHHLNQSGTIWQRSRINLDTLLGFLNGSNIVTDKAISDNKISSTTEPEYCNILRNNLKECNQSGMYDCQYLTTLLEQKCKKELLFTMNNK